MKNGITEYYEDVEINEEYDGYFCSVAEAITIVILGSICGLKNVSQIHQWAANDRVSEFLKENFGINAIYRYRDMYLRPEYYNQLTEKLKVLLADLIADVRNGKDYYIAYEEAQTLIYKSANPSYDPAVDKVGDFCYWNIPAVDGAEFAVAKRLLLEAKNGNEN